MQIEKDIPIPPKGRVRSVAGETARKLEVGESVLLDNEGDLNTANCALRRMGRKAAVRKTDGGWRLWRTA